MANKNLYQLIVEAVGAKKAERELKGVNGKLASMAKKTAGLIAVGVALKKTVDIGMQMAKVSARAEGLNRAFNSLAKNTGLSTRALNTLKKATDGTVGSISLMEQANKAMTLGIVTSEEQMGEMFDIAQRLGKAMGLDVTQSLDSLTTGLGRQSALMLDNLGIMVDSNTAYENYAEELGKTVSELTDAEKKTAFLNEAMDQAKDKANALGQEQLDLNDTFAQFKSVSEELSIAIGTKLQEKLGFLVPILKEGAKAMLDLLAPPDPESIEGMEAALKSLESRYLTLQKSQAMNEESAEKYKKEIADLKTRIGEYYMNLDDNIIIEENKRKAEEAARLEAEKNLTVLDKTKRLMSDLVEPINSRTKAMKALKDMTKLGTEEELKNAALTSKNVKQTVLQNVRAKLLEAVASHVASIFRSVPFPLNIGLAATAGVATNTLFDKVTGDLKFEQGGLVGGRRHSQGGTMIEAEQGEFVMSRDAVSRIGVNNLEAMNSGGGGMTINISAPLVDDTVVDSIIPKIKEAVRRGESLT